MSGPAPAEDWAVLKARELVARWETDPRVKPDSSEEFCIEIAVETIAAALREVAAARLRRRRGASP